MLGIEKNGERLDLSPGTSAQLERLSPFFNENSLAGEYSLPLTFPYTPKNARLLGLLNHFYTNRSKTRVPVKFYDNNNFSYSGELVLETANLHLNDIGKSSINGYFLTGVSDFFSKIKDKKLKELVLGGDRQFTWTDEDPDGANYGFWQHVHETLDGNLDYTFAPVVNEKWSGNSEDGSQDWMNKLDSTGNLDFEQNYNNLAPQVKLRYVLQQIFKENGWTFDYSDMPDTLWETLFMPSFYSVRWKTMQQTIVDPFFEWTVLPSITINLRNHVPPEMLISDLILALRNRYNWGFDFNSNKKVCRMFALKDLANGTKKDWTKYMAAKWQSEFSDDPRTFSFKNEIDGNDSFSSGPDFSKLIVDFPVMTVDDLLPANSGNLDFVVYVWKENNFYQSRYNADLNVYEWQVFAGNIYDFEPTGANASFDTVASTMLMYRRIYRNVGGTDYFGYFPACDQEGNWDRKEGAFTPWGLRLLFYRGRVREATEDYTAGIIQYPYLTSICTTITQEEPDLDWSNVWEHKISDIDKGIVAFWWRPTLKYLSQADVITGILYLPRKELLNFSWSDIILFRNVPYIIQKITETIPYPNAVTAEARRIG
jgi:hypothetical protein